MDVFFLYLGLLCLSLFLIFRYKQKFPGINKLPPGKKGWPIIGETWEFSRACRQGKPEKFVNDRVGKYSPDVFKTSLFGANMAVFCGASGNKFLFSSEDKYVTAWRPSTVLKVLGFSDHDKKKSLKEESLQTRNLLLEFLKPEALQHYVHIMDSMAKEHLMTDWCPYKEVKVFPLSRKYTFAVACRLFMSIKDPEHVITKFADPFNLVTTAMKSIPINFPGTTFHRGIKASKLIRKELREVIKQRKRELLENKEPMAIDLLSRMLLVSDENGRTMDEAQISNFIIGLLTASYDSVSIALTFVMKYLADYPHVYREVLKEQMEIVKSKSPGELLNWKDIQKMKYSWCVACEAMRLSPPSEGAFREATTDFTFAGFTIPKGWKIHWTVHSTHKNPKYFPEPEKFDPSRFEKNGPAPYTFVPFGGGPRMCIGKEYARLEILSFMHNVITKFKWEKIISDEKIIYNPNPFPTNGLLVRLMRIDNK